MEVGRSRGASRPQELCAKELPRSNEAKPKKVKLPETFFSVVLPLSGLGGGFMLGHEAARAMEVPPPAPVSDASTTFQAGPDQLGQAVDFVNANCGYLPTLKGCDPASLSALNDAAVSAPDAALAKAKAITQDLVPAVEPSLAAQTPNSTSPNQAKAYANNQQDLRTMENAARVGDFKLLTDAEVDAKLQRASLAQLESAPTWGGLVGAFFGALGGLVPGVGLDYNRANPKQPPTPEQKLEAELLAREERARPWE